MPSSTATIHKIHGLLGTAVNVQSMVFGNLGEDSGTGVCFTRDPSTGENVFYGEFLMNAQGEDVVAGIRTPEPLRDLEKHDAPAYRKLCRIRRDLEKHYRDIQDIEFTIEDGTLYILQTRTGKTTPGAAVRIAVEMVKQRLITKEEAVARITPDQIDQLLHPQFDPRAERNVLDPRPRGESRRGERRGGLHGRGCEGPGAEGATRHPRPRRDEPGGRRRHARGGGHPHRHGRHDLARGRRRARHGQVLRRGCRRRADRHAGALLPHRRAR